MSDTSNANKLEELGKMKVNDLKKELKARGLSTVGKKQELIDRLMNHSESSVSDIEDNVLDEHNILDEDDALEYDFGDSDIDESKVLGDIPEKEENNVGNGIIHDEKEVQQVIQPKKVTLKRSSVTMLNGDDIKPKEEGKTNDEIEESINENRIIKLGEVEAMSQTERIQLRIKRFGNVVSEDKKLARLIKFAAVSDQKSVANVDNDKLQMSAERFSETVSKTLHDVIQPKKVTLKRSSVTMLNGDDIKPKEEEKTNNEIEESINKNRIIKLGEVEAMSQTERIQLRAKRFGNVALEDKKLARIIKFAAVTDQKSVANVDNDKLKMSAERFGENVSKTLDDVFQPKKVTLKRSSVTMLNGDDIKPKEEGKTYDEIEESINKDRIIKLGEVETMSQTERIQLRAKRFGNVASEDKKLDRLIKFGAVTDQSEKEDKHKARELRFGSIDKTMLTAIKKRNNGYVGKQKNTTRGGHRRFPYKKLY